MYQKQYLFTKVKLHIILTHYQTTKFQTSPKHLKAFADEKLNMIKKLKFVVGWVENIEGKEENACFQHFLLFPQYFLKASFSGSLKSGLCGKRVKPLPHNSDF